MDDDDNIRKINLIQVHKLYGLPRHIFASIPNIEIGAAVTQILEEDADADGLVVPELPDSAAREWSESQIRQHFARNQQGPLADVTVRAPEEARSCYTAHEDRLHQTRPGQGPSIAVLAQWCQAFDAPSAVDFTKWFPGLAASGTATPKPELRILCFPNAGNAEDMYTSEGTGVRRAPNPLLVGVKPAMHGDRCPSFFCFWASSVRIRCLWQEWCRANGAECLAVQPPGRAMRSKEASVTSATELAAQLLPIVASRLMETPYIVRWWSASSNNQGYSSHESLVLVGYIS